MGQYRSKYLQDILVKFKAENFMQTKMLPVKHFENLLFHSLRPYDYQLKLDKG